MSSCLQTLSKVAKVKVLIHCYSLSLIHFFSAFFLMFPILPPFHQLSRNISEFFKIFEILSKFFKSVQQKRFIISIKVDMEIIKPLLV